MAAVRGAWCVRTASTSAEFKCRKLKVSNSVRRNVFLLFEESLARLICTTDAVTSVCISKDYSVVPGTLNAIQSMAVGIAFLSHSFVFLCIFPSSRQLTVTQPFISVRNSLSYVHLTGLHRRLAINSRITDLYKTSPFNK
jgi:hypothetical protein